MKFLGKMNVTYKNIKSHQIPWHHPVFRKHNCGNQKMRRE